MSTATQTPPVAAKYDERTIINFPNQVTMARLVLSIVLFVLLHFEQYWISFWLFLVTVGTDWLDGFWARRYGQITILGRMLDPFVDKVVICGTYIFLAAAPGSGLVAWMAVLVLAREMLVTALRSFLEQQGADFSAAFSGKLKFIAQCWAAAASLYWLSYSFGTPHPAPLATTIEPQWVQWITVISIWTMIVMTLYSGWDYIAAAVKIIRKNAAKQ